LISFSVLSLNLALSSPHCVGTAGDSFGCTSVRAFSRSTKFHLSIAWIIFPHLSLFSSETCCKLANSFVYRTTILNPSIKLLNAEYKWIPSLCVMSRKRYFYRKARIIFQSRVEPTYQSVIVHIELKTKNTNNPTRNSTKPFLRDLMPNVHMGPNSMPANPRHTQTKAATRRLPGNAAQPKSQKR